MGVKITYVPYMVGAIELPVQPLFDLFQGIIRGEGHAVHHGMNFGDDKIVAEVLVEKRGHLGGELFLH